MKLIKELLDQFEPLAVTEATVDVTPEIVIDALNNRKSPATLNADGSIDVDGDLIISSAWLRDGTLQVKFGTVDGNVYARNIGLKTLKNFPKVIHGGLNVSDNLLTNFKGSLVVVEGDITAESNRLTALDGLPDTILGDLNILGNKNLKSFHNIHKIIKRMEGVIIFDEKVVKSSVLGLFLIPGLTGIRSTAAGGNFWDRDYGFDIVVSNLEKGKEGMFDCQEELINAKFEELAKP